MSETKSLILNGVPETMLLPLYTRAIESQRPDAIMKDEKAVALVTQMQAQMRSDFERIRQIPMPELLKVMRIMFTREMDRYAQDFLRRHPVGVVVHIGCGLDSRFERVDNGRVEWFDLDLPDVIDLRRKFICDERERYHLLACSVLEDAWLEAVKVHSQRQNDRRRPCLFLAETVFVYFTEAQVKSLVLTLRDHFPGAELVFDGWRPFEVWLGNRYLSNSPFASLMNWGLWRGQELEGWSDGVRLLDEWGFFNQPEPRLDRFRWMAPLFRLFKPMRIFHFQLGEAEGEKPSCLHIKRKLDMSETTIPNLSGVAETLLITLYIRAMESQRPDALVKDERAETLIRQLDQESLRKTLSLTDDFSRVAVILKGREFDRFAQVFLAHHPDAVVVHIGCGLDTRFERICHEQADNGRVEWYDLDLPDVIELRRKLVGGEEARHHYLARSVLDYAWMDAISVHGQRPYLFLAEGVFMYFEEAQVKSLVLALRDHFPGAELVFDAFSPIMRWGHNIRVTRTRVGAYLHWGLKHGSDLERWCGSSSAGGGIRFLDERFPFQYPEPRMRRALQMRIFPFLAKAVGVYRYQL